MDIAISYNKVPIRLTEERWYHISTGHPEIVGYYFEILETIEQPFCIYEGNAGELIAIKFLKKLPGKFIASIYKKIELESTPKLVQDYKNKAHVYCYFFKKNIIYKTNKHEKNNTAFLFFNRTANCFYTSSAD